MSKKGISPLIAAVLLIAFVVSVAMIIMGWFSSYVRTTTTNISASSEAAVGCSTAIITLDSVYVTNSGADATMIVRNEGQISLDVRGTLININGTACSNATAVTIPAGSTGTIVIDSCLVPNAGNFSKAIVTTSCSGITDSTTKASSVTFV